MPQKRTSGFTLIELIIVLVVVGVLALVAVPWYMRHIKKDKTVAPPTAPQGLLVRPSALA